MRNVASNRKLVNEKKNNLTSWQGRKISKEGTILQFS